MKGRLLVISGPSGSGKSSIVGRLLRSLQLDFSVSATTRPPRPGEIEGRHYRFVTPSEFEELIESGELLEWAIYNGNYYGTPAAPIQEANEKGTDVLLEIEIQGARQIRDQRADAIMFFVVPPSMGELEERLRGRGDTSEPDIAQRLAIARSELDEAETLFDHIIVNDVLERATDEIADLIIGSR